MRQKGFPHIPKQVIPYLVICTGITFGFIILAIYPYQRHLANLNTDIETLETQIQEQEMLNPIYRNLMRQINLTDRGTLPDPEKGTLESHRVSELSSVFGQKAENSNLDLINVVPDVTSLVKATEHLSVTAVLKGSFFDFREFLVQINEIPYLRHIEEIQIQPQAGAREMRVKVWLALDR